MTIFLCGFMGCGKSTIGKILAKNNGCNFCDTDELIVRNQGMTIPEIFSQKGEPYFRTVEAETVKSLCGKSTVVACGGGAMQNTDTADTVRKNGGTIIYLYVPFETCYERIKDDSNRPIVMNNTREQLEEIYNKRHEIYKKNSTMMIEAVGSPVEIVRNIIDIIR
ncbi:MAG: shikimate kinase [Ruminococcus sp.]|nr:shikimate kinase [Ruminococcus sp.]